MSKAPYGMTRDQEDTIGAFLESVAKFVCWVGLLATVVGIGFLIFYYVSFSGYAPASAEAGEQNIATFLKVLVFGEILLLVGLTYLFWGEETLGVLLLIGAGLLYFSPLFLPSLIFGGPSDNPIANSALGAIQTGGAIAGLIAVIVVVLDFMDRARTRVKYGSKADQMKYGKDVKEREDRQNVFMGKCWQLPFCRKFVREQCPIYHSKRTCWKERVGCMCEEQVIRNAMEGKSIPKEAVAAAQFIPYNNRLTLQQKQERCRQCVIYNEHQRHKYRLILPLSAVFFALFYLVFRQPLLQVSGGLLDLLDKGIGRATFRDVGAIGQTVSQSVIPFKEILLVCVFVILFAYSVKVIEFLVFKAKV